jgi:solute carrier family 25 (mitochondrial phosphate transporter), member 23/24/25/41
MWGMTLKVVREEGGLRALYRGMLTTAMGVAPYVGINFAAYETLRGIITPPGKTTVPRKLSCGALAGTCFMHVCFRVGQGLILVQGLTSQTLTYPFDVLRRKMQVSGMKAGVLDTKYRGAIDALRTIVRTEGFRGLYRGLWPNLRKF